MASLSNDDGFGAPASIGDLNGDGIGDIAVGAKGDDDGGTNRGAIYIIFLDKYGRALSHQKISDTQGGFTGSLDNNDEFGSAIEFIGDLNGDGAIELMVGSQYDDDGGTDKGAVWILSIKPDGTVKSHKKISDTQGGFNGNLGNADNFGNYLGTLGDLNNDNVTDIAVGATGDDDGGINRGAVFVLFLDTSGQVINEQKISDTAGNFTGVLDNNDRFGHPTGIGDLNNDGFEDLAVGASLDDDGGTDRGAVWILFLDSMGKVQSHQKISDAAGNFIGTLNNSDGMGNNIRAIGDLNGDLVQDIMVSSGLDNDGGVDRGAIWIMFMQSNGNVGAHLKISDTVGNFHGLLDNGDQFGSRLTYLGDFNNDGMIDIAASAIYDDDGGTSHGATWILSLDRCQSGCSGGIQNTFEKVFLTNSDERGHSIIASKDNNYFLTGTTTSGAGGTDIFVMKLNEYGDTIWTKTYGSTGNETTNSIKIRQISDSNIVFAARTFSFSTNNGGMYLVSIDNDGNINWEQLIDSVANEQARSIEVTEDGGFIVSGTNGYIIKFDPVGNIEWQRYYSGGGNLHMTSVREISGIKNYVFSGESSSYGQGGRSTFIVCLDSTGSEKWEMILDNAFRDAGTALHITKEKTIIIGGVTWFSTSISSRSMFLAEIDTTGKLIRSKYYSTGADDLVGFIMDSKNDGFMLAGHSEKNGAYRNVIMEVDRYGNLLWSNSYLGKSTSIETHWAEKIIYTKDNGFFLSSYTNNFNSNSNFDVYLQKLDQCGQGCNQQPIEFTQEERTWNISNTNSSVITWASPESIFSEVGFLPVADSLICEFDPACQLVSMFTFDTICVGDTTQFTDLSYDSLANVTGWQWSFGDGNLNNIDQHPYHRYDSAGTFLSQLVVFNDDTTYCSDTLQQFVSVLPTLSPDLGKDTSFCYGQTYNLNPGGNNQSYYWSDSTIGPNLIADTTGVFWVEVSNPGCSASDSVFLNFHIPPKVDLGPDTIICQGDSIFFNLFIPGATYLWSDSSTNSYNSINYSYNHWIKVDSGKCSVLDSINLVVNQFPVVDLGNDTTICESDSILLIGSSSLFSHVWVDNSIDTFLVADSNKVFWVNVSNGPCQSTDSINISLDSLPLFNLGNDTTFCQGDTFRLNTYLTLPNLFLWNNGSSNSSLLIDSSGLYSVQVTNGVCVETDSILIGYDDSLSLDLGLDTSFCEGMIYVLDANQSGATYLWNDSSTLSTLTVTASGIFSVLVTSANQACISRDTVNILFDTLPMINLVDDTSICENDTLILNAFWPGASYLWHDGSTSSMFQTSVSGKFWVSVQNGKCLVIDSTTLNVVKYPDIEVDSLYFICQGDTLEVAIDSTHDKYLWSNTDSSFYTTYTDSGAHWVLTQDFACSIVDSFHLEILPIPEEIEKYHFEICDEGLVEIDAGNNGAQYKWSDGSSKQIATVNDTGKIYVEIILANGCSIIDSCNVGYCEFEVDIPNTITPNGDGSNDYWVIDGIEYYPENIVQIFNRNGQLLFEKNGYRNDWNGTWEGKELPATVYFFVVDLGKGKNKFKGTLTIIRE